MKTHRTFLFATAIALASLAGGALLSLGVSHAATPSFAPAAKSATSQQINARIQQELQQELRQRHDLNVARIHHEFALKDAEIHRMRHVIARKDAEIRQLRASLGRPVSGG